MGEDGINLNAMRMGPGKHLYGRKLPGGVKPEEFTYFHELVVVQELTRIGECVVVAGRIDSQGCQNPAPFPAVSEVCAR